MSKQLFFCFGPPKSGTTFLQRILDLHPEISCPPEHHFDFLFNHISESLKRYENDLKTFDSRTGGQGITPVGPVIYQELFRFTVQSMIWESAKGKKIAGANDNTIGENIKTYNGIFNSPKFIVIFRNPIDTAISAWHHNMKLAVEENRPEHKLRMTRLGGIEEWIKIITRNFVIYVQTYLNFSKEHNNIIMVRYEDLKDDKKANLIRLFDFLGASTSDEILSSVIEKSSLNAMREASVRKDFFRSGSTDMGEGIVSDDLRREITSMAHDELLALNYDLSL